jgi:hypothetical protein
MKITARENHFTPSSLQVYVAIDNILKMSGSMSDVPTRIRGMAISLFIFQAFVFEILF